MSDEISGGCRTRGVCSAHALLSQDRRSDAPAAVRLRYTSELMGQFTDRLVGQFSGPPHCALEYSPVCVAWFVRFLLALSSLSSALPSGVGVPLDLGPMLRLHPPTQDCPRVVRY